MGERITTLPNGLKVKVEGGEFLLVQYPGASDWHALTNCRADMDVLVAAIQAECAQTDRRRGR